MAPDSAQTPSGWETRELGQVLEHVIDFRGRTPKKLGMDWGGGAIPALSANNVKMGGVNLSEPTFYGSDALYKRWMTSGESQHGDVLITMEAPLGNVAQIPDTQRYILSQRVVLLRFDPRTAVNAFAAHQMRSERVQRNLERWSTGTTATGIQRARLVHLPLVIPPLPEQHQITAILDTIDDAIRTTEQIIVKLKQLRQGLLQDLLTCGIDDNGELRDPNSRPEQFKDSPLGRIPRGWDIASLERLTTRIVDGVHHTPTYVEQGVPFLTVQNLTWGSGVSLEPRRHVSERAHAAYWKRADPREGDVLVTKDGTLGVARVVPSGLPEFSIFVSLALLRPASGIIRAELIAEFFDTPSYLRQLGRQSAGTGLKHIHLEHFREFQLVVPPMAEQDRIVAGLRSSTRRLEAEREDLSKLRLLKAGLMEDLLTGRVRVTRLLETAAE